MARPTNEQSLLQDRAGRILTSRGVASAAFDWRGPRTLLVHVDPAEWTIAGRSMPAVEQAAADRGFKALLLAPGPVAGTAVRGGAPARHTVTLRLATTEGRTLL